MSDNVVKFYPANAGENPDTVLEWARGELKDVLVIGWDKDGCFRAFLSAGLVDGANALFLAEAFKTKLMNGDFAEGADD